MYPFLERINNLVVKPLVDFIKSPPNKVAVLELYGVIGANNKLRSGGMSASAMESAIEKAFSVSGVKAVAVSINSPGGSPVQSALIYQHIRGLAEEKDVPVYVFAEDVAASGGYWLACVGDKIYAQESSIIGSIGVVSSGFGLEDFIKRYDIKRRLYTQGENKAMMDPFMPEKADDIKRIKAIQADIHESFKILVKERRAAVLKDTNKELFTGSVWSGKEALELGLVDEIGELRSVMKKEFGNNVKLKKISTDKGLLSRLMGGGKASAYAPDEWIDALLEKAEARALWARFGL